MLRDVTIKSKNVIYYYVHTVYSILMVCPAKLKSFTHSDLRQDITLLVAYNQIYLISFTIETKKKDEINLCSMYVHTSIALRATLLNFFCYFFRTQITLHYLVRAMNKLHIPTYLVKKKHQQIILPRLDANRNETQMTIKRQCSAAESEQTRYLLVSRDAVLLANVVTCHI